jgi:ankyrin repeat protein
LVEAGADVNDADAWGVTATVLAAHSGYRDLVEFLLEKGADPNLAAAGFTALHAAIMHRDAKLAAALLAHGADPNAPLKTWTPTRRSSRDFHFHPPLVGATPFWLAARFTQPDVMRLLVKHGADPLFVHRPSYFMDNLQPRSEVITPVMAALGMGGGMAWVQIPPGDREPLSLEAVKLLADLGVDLNTSNTDGRTALDAATALGYKSVVEFLAQKGAKSGKPGTSARN